MSTTTTTTEVLEVVVATALDTEKTFNLNNPVTTVTLADVRTAFQTLINANDSDCVVFGTKELDAYTNFKRAAIIQTVKRTTPLE